MTDLSDHECAEIFQGEVRSMQDLIALHRTKKIRPDNWFIQPRTNFAGETAGRAAIFRRSRAPNSEEDRMSLIHTHTILDAFHGVLDDESARAVIDYRKRMGKRFALTERSARMLAKELSRCPNPEAAADEMMLRGWTSVKAEWVKQKPVRQSYTDIIREMNNDQHSRDDSYSVERLSYGPGHGQGDADQGLFNGGSFLQH